MELDYSVEQEMRDGDDLPEWSPRIVYMNATVTGLTSPLIPFVVLKHDPIARHSFDQETRSLSYDQEQSLEAVRESWDAPASELPREQHYFLMAWSAYPPASPLTADVAGLTFGIATPGPLFKRWITTGAVERHGELVAWCEEVDMLGIQEEVIEVRFTEANMIRLMPGQDVEQDSKVA